MFSGIAVFKFREITLSLLLYQKIISISICNWILNEHQMKMIDNYATSSGSQKSKDSTKPVAVCKEIKHENEWDIEEIIYENIKEWPVICLDYLLLVLTIFTST